MLPDFLLYATKCSLHTVKIHIIVHNKKYTALDKNTAFPQGDAAFSDFRPGAEHALGPIVEKWTGICLLLGEKGAESRRSTGFCGKTGFVILLIKSTILRKMCFVLFVFSQSIDIFC